MAHEEQPSVVTSEERRVSLSITVRPSTRDRLDAAAKDENNTISRIAERAVLAYLETKGF